MSDKNFKVKNGIDAVGPITISPSSNATNGLIINTLAGGQAITFNREGSNVGSIDDWGTYNGSGINIVQPWYVRSPGLEAQSFFWVGSGARSAAGFAGTSSGTNPVIYISQTGTGTNDLTQWVTPNNTILAKVDYLGNITARDLTLSGNLTVNGTTTSINSTTLVVNDKNIEIAKVATPTDTTADGAGITIKGATDKTFNWVSSTKSFTSSEPLVINNSSITTVPLVIKGYASQTSDLLQIQDNTGSVIIRVLSAGHINTNAPVNVNGFPAGLTFFGVKGNDGSVPISIIQGSTSQTANLTEWQNNSNQVVSSIRSDGGLSINYAKSIRLFNTQNTDYASIWMDNGSGGTNLYVKTNYPVLMGDVGVDTGASLTVATQSVSQIGQVIRGISSQTADLQQWQRSNGNPDLKVTNFGTLISGGGTTIASNPTINAYGAAVKISSGVNSYPMLILQGAASQAANIEEWQNSAGTKMSTVSPLGYLSINKSYTSYPLEVNGSLYAKDTTSANLYIQGGNNLLYPSVITSAGGNGWTSVTANYAVSPDGTTSATRYLWASNGNCYTTPAFVAPNIANVFYTASMYVKPNISTSKIILSIRPGDSSDNSNVEFDASTNTVAYSQHTPTSVFSNGTAGLIYVGNGWYRIWVTSKISSVLSGFTVMITSNNPNGDVSIWGVQLEQGYYASVYTPTTNAIVTSTNNLYVPSGSIYSPSIQSLVSNTATLNTNGDTGAILINTVAAANKGLIVKGYTSQTADLQQWRQADNTIGTKIGSYGEIIGNNTLANSIGPTISGVMWGVTAGLASYVPIVVRGASSQTANLQEWQNSAGAARTSILSDGALFSNMYATFTNAGAGGGNAILVKTIYATDVPLAVRGAASQTGNLQEWQNSAGTVLLRINAAGQIQAPQPASVGLVVKAATTLTATITNAVGNATTVTYTATNTFTAGQTITITGVNPSAYNLASVTVATASASSFTVTNAAVGTYVSGGTATVAQSTSLQQWQDSAGSVLASISQTGQFILNYGNVNGLNSTFGLSIGGPAGFINYNNSYGSYQGMLHFTRGNTVGNWMNIYTRGDGSNGVLNMGIGNGSNIQLVQIGYDGGVLLTGNTAATVGLVVKGFASQTANLTEWQDSTSTVISTIDSAGRIFTRDYLTVERNAGAGSTIVSQNWSWNGGANWGLRLNQVYSTSPSGSIDYHFVTRNNSFTTDTNAIFIKASGLVGFNIINQTSAQVFVNNSTASNVGLIVKGAASQTANLQEWQAQNGTVLGNINAYGAAYFGEAAQITQNSWRLRSTWDYVGGVLQLRKSASSSAVGASDYLQLGIVSGTTSGTLKLVARGGTSGAETTIFDNIDQTVGIANPQTITSPAILKQGLIVKAAPSLTATITAVSGNGTTVTYIASNSFTAGQVVTITGVNPTAYNLAYVTIASASSTQFTVTNSATGTYVSGGTANAVQTAALQEWRDASDNVIASFTDNSNNAGSATFFFNDGIKQPTFPWGVPFKTSWFTHETFGPQYYFRTTQSNAQWLFQTPGAPPLLTVGISGITTIVPFKAYSATDIAFIARGVASQTADLQQWQNSAGTVLAKVDSNGSITAGTNLIVGNATMLYTGGNYYNSTLSVATQGAGYSGIVVRGQASQTANLQEWQNSAGAARTSILSDGALFSNMYATFTNAGAGGGNAILVKTIYATDVPLAVRGAASQTGNLQEWQNSAGTVLAKVDKDGNVNTSSSFVQTGTIGTTYAIDASGNQATYAANATVNFPNFSGMILIDAQIDGTLSLWLCGGGAAARIGGSKTGGYDGSVAYNSGISGYTWTNANTSQNVNITAIRTRSAG